MRQKSSISYRLQMNKLPALGLIVASDKGALYDLQMPVGLLFAFGG